MLKIWFDIYPHIVSSLCAYQPRELKIEKRERKKEEGEKWKRKY